MTIVSDEEIIQLYLRRDESAISATSDSYGPYCRAIASRILGSGEDAGECLNDTWLRVWESIPPQRPRHFKAFLAKITRNLAFDRFKREHARKRGSGELQLALDELDECVPAASDVESEVLSEELKRCIEHFLRDLPGQKRAVFLRRYFYVESAAAIAKRYGLKEGHVQVLLSRTRRELKAHLKKEGFWE